MDYLTEVVQNDMHIIPRTEANSSVCLCLSLTDYAKLVTSCLAQTKLSQVTFTFSHLGVSQKDRTGVSFYK